MLILYSLMEKNSSLGNFQLRKSIDFIVKVSEIILVNLRVKYEHESKTIICYEFTHIFQKQDLLKFKKKLLRFVDKWNK